MEQEADREDHGRSLLIDDAARLLGVSRRTVYYRIRQGRLKTIRTRCGSQRVLVSSIESLLRALQGPSDFERVATTEPESDAAADATNGSGSDPANRTGLDVEG